MDIIMIVVMSMCTIIGRALNNIRSKKEEVFYV